MSQSNQDIEKHIEYFRFVELVLLWDWRLTTNHLCTNFVIDRQKAQRILKKYMGFNPNSIEHNRSLRGYIPLATFQPKVLSSGVTTPKVLSEPSANNNRWSKTLSDYFIYVNEAYNKSDGLAQDITSIEDDIPLSHSLSVLPYVEANVNPDFIRSIRFAMGRGELLKMQYTPMYRDDEDETQKWRVIRPIHLTKTPKTLLLGAVEIEVEGKQSNEARYKNFNVSRINSIECGLSETDEDKRAAFKLRHWIQDKLSDNESQALKSNTKQLADIYNAGGTVASDDIDRRLDEVIRINKDKSISKNKLDKALNSVVEDVKNSIEKLGKDKEEKVDIVLCTNPNYNEKRRKAAIHEFGLSIEKECPSVSSLDEYTKTISLPKYAVYIFDKLYRYPRYQRGIKSIFLKKIEKDTEIKVNESRRKIDDCLETYTKIYKDLNSIMIPASASMPPEKKESVKKALSSLQERLKDSGLTALLTKEGLALSLKAIKQLERLLEKNDKDKTPPEHLLNDFEGALNELYCLVYSADRFLIDLLNSELVVKNHRQINDSLAEENKKKNKQDNDEKLLYLNVIEKLDFIFELQKRAKDEIAKESYTKDDKKM